MRLDDPATPPPDAPLAMPVRGACDAPGPVGCPPPEPARTPAARRAMMALIAAFAAGLVAAFWHALAAGGGLDAADTVLLGLFTVNALWIAAGAAGALIGAVIAAPAGTDRPPPPGWTPAARCAVLWLVCGEAPAPLARRVAALQRDLERNGLATVCDTYILSDTADPAAAWAERQALAGQEAPGRVHYRRRVRNTGRKPGNIADWLTRHGGAYETMLVMDADSRIGARRLRGLLHRMETAPWLGLIQTGMRLLPGRSRFSAMQRLSARLCGPGFINGLAAWAGMAGNFWGHNALIRTRALAEAGGLPRLSGAPPFGGPVLSHDFIEAAWLRRAGWGVEIAPDTRASFEEAPETFDAFHRRDRRWCQGNLQHLRLIGAAGLHPISRLHMLSGVQSYLAAPLWLGLVLLLALGGAGRAGGVAALWPLGGALALLLAPKFAGLAAQGAGLRGWRRRVYLRAALCEAGLSSLLAPIVMLRQTCAVGAVLLGRDCGWQRPRPPGPARALPQGAGEVLAGAGLIALVAAASPAPLTDGLVISPVALPLLLARVIIRWMDAAPGSASAVRSTAAMTRRERFDTQVAGRRDAPTP
ncbi:glucans biosynthesis glucosyltransferase MdoH [Rhodobacteraceae bacterium WD3A24]|nr:glucans biosynthesis glucosyltransferase MdoH [Rhodobacteraceae bacterium WD3A24]